MNQSLMEVKIGQDRQIPFHEHTAMEFKKLLGINFFDYLNQFRLKRAQEMLVQNMNQSVAQIAIDCGFLNLTSFYKNFNQLTGTSRLNTEVK